MDQNYILALSKAYPWATEDTLQEMLEVVTVDAATKKKLLDTIRNQPTDYSEIVDVLKNKNLALKLSTDNSIKFIKSFERDSANIEKMFDTAEDIAWGMVSAADELEDSMDFSKFSKSKWAKFARIATDVGENVAVGIATGVSVASYFSRYALEQEKIMRGMIDFGMVLGDNVQYTNIRSAMSALGMTENEYLKNAQGFGPIFANLGGDTYSGTIGIARLANTIYGSKNNLGLSAEDVFNSLMNESSMLLRLGEIESLDQRDMKRITSGFSTSIGIASMLSELTGQERTTYLENRQQMQEDIDFITAFNRSRAYINQTFGEGHSERVRENVTLITELMGMLTPELQDATRETLTRHIYDISLDSSVLNNITPSIYKQLSLLGSDVQASYLELMTMAVNDETADVSGITMKFRDFAKLIRQSNPVFFLNEDEERVQARSIQDNAMLMSQSFINASNDQFYLANYLDGLIDSDDPIRAVDQFKQSLTIIRNTLVPGYNTTGIAIDYFSKGMGFIGDAVIGGIPDIKNEGIQTSHVDSYTSQKQMKDRLFQQAQMGNTNTPEGMNNYLNAVRGAIVGGNRSDMGQYVSSSFGVDFPTIEKLFQESTGGENFSPEYVPPKVAAKRIADALNEFGINDPRAVSNILGMISGESNFQLINETSYSGTSVGRIKKVLASRALFYTDDELERLKKDDKAFYDAMYGSPQAERRRIARDAGKRRPDTGGAITDRFIAGGDMGGYAYRGKGYVQLTGEENYRRVGEFLGIDLVGNPNLALDPYHGPRVAAAFYALMSDSRKANFVDSRKVYKYTWGADPSNGKMDDYRKRAAASNNWLAMMNDERWEAIDTSIPESSNSQPDVKPSDTASSDTTSSDTTSSDTTSSDTASSDTVSSDTTSSETASSDTASSDTASSDPSQPNVNSDSYSVRNIGGEEYVPGSNLTDNQVAAVQTRIAMGNTVDPKLIEDYNRTLNERQDNQVSPSNESSPTVNGESEFGMVPPRPDGNESVEWDSDYGNTHNTDGTPKDTLPKDTINTDIEPEINSMNEIDSEITSTLNEVNLEIQKDKTERESVQ
jgi:predicted chitinase